MVSSLLDPTLVRSTFCWINSTTFVNLLSYLLRFHIGLEVDSGGWGKEWLIGLTYGSLKQNWPLEEDASGFHPPPSYDTLARYIHDCIWQDFCHGNVRMSQFNVEKGTLSLYLKMKMFSELAASNFMTTCIYKLPYKEVQSFNPRLIHWSNTH